MAETIETQAAPETAQASETESTESAATTETTEATDTAQDTVPEAPKSDVKWDAALQQMNQQNANIEKILTAIENQGGKPTQAQAEKLRSSQARIATLREKMSKTDYDAFEHGKDTTLEVLTTVEELDAKIALLEESNKKLMETVNGQTQTTKAEAFWLQEEKTSPGSKALFDKAYKEVSARYSNPEHALIAATERWEFLKASARMPKTTQPIKPSPKTAPRPAVSAPGKGQVIPAQTGARPTPVAQAKPFDFRKLGWFD